MIFSRNIIKIFFILLSSKVFSQESRYPVLKEELELINKQLISTKELSKKVRDSQQNLQKLFEEEPILYLNKKNQKFLLKNLSSRQKNIFFQHLQSLKKIKKQLLKKSFILL